MSVIARPLATSGRPCPSLAHRPLHRQLRTRLRPLLAAMAVAGVLGPVATAQAAAPTIADTTLPTGMTLKAGEATVRIDDVNNVMTTTQTSSRAVWETQNFSVGAKAAFTNNATLGANTDTLIRVIGFSPSVINGPVTSNNRLWLVNSNGMFVGSTGSINAASVMMAARDVNAAEVGSGYAAFMNPNAKAKLLVDASSNDFSGGFIEIDQRVDAEGKLLPSITATGSAKDGFAGGVVLMGSTYVYNKGLVQANGGGAIAMVSANDVTVQVGDSGFIELAPLSATATQNNTLGGRAVYNEGTIEANDGKVELTVAGSGNDGWTLGGQGSTTAAQTNLAVVNTGITLNGVANRGTINARVTRQGGSSSVLMQSVGGVGNSVVYNLGTVDASALSGVAAKGGNIDLVGPNVGNGGNPGNATSGQLLADGDQGGGQITLAVRDATGDTAKSGLMVTNDQSLISADARVNGQGGTVRLLGNTNVSGLDDTKTTTTSAASANVNTDVTVQGTLQARGGVSGGDGGTIVVSGTAVSLRTTDPEFGTTSARFAVGARSDAGKSGWLKLYSPYVTIGTAQALANTDFGGAQLVDADLSSYLSDGANIEIGAFKAQGYTALVNVQPGADITSDSSTAQTLRLVSDDDVTIGSAYDSTGTGVNIEAQSAAMNVTVKADANGDGNGNIRIEGLDPSLMQVNAAPGRAQAQSVATDAPVRILTLGGDLTLTGRALFNGNNAYADPVYVRNAVFDTQGGRISITGSGGIYLGEGSVYSNGVTLADSSLSGGDITIQGISLANTGVSLDGVSLATTTNGQITVHGLAKDAASPGEHTGVSIDRVDVNLGQGGKLKVTGLAAGGEGNDFSGAIGVKVGDMTVTTDRDFTGALVPRVTVVGQSAQSSQPGLQVNGGIRLGDTSEGPSRADVVLGAKADAQAATAIALGNSNFGTVGGVNVRPLQVDTAGTLVADHATGIYVGPETGAAAAGTNFAVDPNLFNGTMGTGMNVVVGSSQHTGQITVAPDVFNGAVITTLQNQGAGAKGITVGAQSGQSAYLPVPSSTVGRAQAAAVAGASAGVLNLLSAGNINQTGPINAQSIVVVAGPGASVNLGDPGNAVDTLVVQGGSQVTVANGATPSGTATATAYDAGSQQFVTITATTNPNEVPVRPTGPTDAEIAVTPSRSTVQSTEALSELRTDVYVRGQFTRPQVCTPASTGGSVAVDIDLDPLSQQWLQVRRSAQLSSCSGVRNDSSCSAF